MVTQFQSVCVCVFYVFKKREHWIGPHPCHSSDPGIQYWHSHRRVGSIPPCTVHRWHRCL